MILIAEKTAIELLLWQNLTVLFWLPCGKIYQCYAIDNSYHISIYEGDFNLIKDQNFSEYKDLYWTFLISLPDNTEIEITS